MHSEYNRLQTFESWPQNAPVDSNRLARAGFYFTGPGLAVQCFCCGRKILEWNSGDQVMTRHRELSPGCQFVQNPAASGNIAIALPNPLFDGSVRALTSNSAVPASNESSTLQRNARVPDESDMIHFSHGALFRSESVRLDTFRTWPIPHIVSPERLAKAGFYYLGTADQVKCAFCGGCIAFWEEGDDPVEEHKKHFPTCTPNSPIPIGNISLNETSSSNTAGTSCACSGAIAFRMRELGIQMRPRPRYPQFSTLESRLGTFDDWPDNVVQRPPEMAEAGFFYSRTGDSVRCFHCGCGLSFWEPSDEPWTEHARWFNFCPFLRLVKGEEFAGRAVTPLNAPSKVNDVPDTSRSAPDPLMETDNSPTLPSSSVQSSQTPPAEPEIIPERPLGRRLSDDELGPYMDSPIVRAALCIGVDLPQIKAAVRLRVQKTGLMFTGVDTLIKAVYEVRDQERNAPELSSSTADSMCQSLPSLARSANTESETSTENATSSRALGQGVSALPSGREDVQMDLQSNELLNILEEENRRLREAKLCKVCFVRDAQIVFLPCGHLATCADCAPHLVLCCVCRQLIMATILTYIS